MKALEDLRTTALETMNAVLGSPVTTELIHRTTDARESVLRAQEVLLATLNLPTATEFSLLHGRVRSVSERLDTIEDQLDELVGQMRALSTTPRGPTSAEIRTHDRTGGQP
ncbi:hypothetical protein NONO_c51680 [Nocardia nova SH22a]|uniref:Uncharacterized protein n=1 Tax=Nocardia nova SH22a TaxID=1415166 RepID=W5TL18_9NOCA|nr:hypothetical protein [Nocardia nova]AHH19952.1 hypothetical protein NONO_c51680 [Nocardia nova SH22a]